MKLNMCTLLIALSVLVSAAQTAQARDSAIDTMDKVMALVNKNAHESCVPIPPTDKADKTVESYGAKVEADIGAKKFWKSLLGAHLGVNGNYEHWESQGLDAGDIKNVVMTADECLGRAAITYKDIAIKVLSLPLQYKVQLQNDQEKEVWQYAELRAQRRAYRFYLNLYPNGPHAALARYAEAHTDDDGFELDDSGARHCMPPAVSNQPKKCRLANGNYMEERAAKTIQADEDGFELDKRGRRICNSVRDPSGPSELAMHSECRMPNGHYEREPATFGK